MNVQRKQLKNGLVVVSESMPHLRSASIGVWVKVGSRFEDQRSSGISHFIEHLLFKGTRSRTAVQIAEAVDSVGGQLNAFTDKEYVGFYAKVLDRHLKFAFDLLSDIVFNPIFPSDEMERERNVIFEEINMVEDSPQESIHDIFMENFWKGHPLGRPIPGTKQSVARITRKEVLQFFKEHYTGCNTVISVAGNIRHRKVQDLADRYFSKLDPGKPTPQGQAPAVHASRVLRNKSNLEQTHICLGTPCPELLSKDRYAIYVLSSVLGGGMSSRLFQNIREKRGLVYTIYSSPNMYRDAGALVVYAGAAPDKASLVVELTLKEFKRLREKLVAPEELKRAKENIKGSLMLSLEGSSSRMTHLANEEIYFGRFYRLEEILANVDRTRAVDLRRISNEMLASGDISLIVLGSDNARELKSVPLKV